MSAQIKAVMLEYRAVPFMWINVQVLSHNCPLLHTITFQVTVSQDRVTDHHVPSHRVTRPSYRPSRSKSPCHKTELQTITFQVTVSQDRVTDHHVPSHRVTRPSYRPSRSKSPCHRTELQTITFQVTVSQDRASLQYQPDESLTGTSVAVGMSRREISLPKSKR